VTDSVCKIWRDYFTFNHFELWTFFQVICVFFLAVSEYKCHVADNISCFINTICYILIPFALFLM
jgi:hypothetical protein